MCVWTGERVVCNMCLGRVEMVIKVKLRMSMQCWSKLCGPASIDPSLQGTSGFVFVQSFCIICSNFFAYFIYAVSILDMLNKYVKFCVKIICRFWEIRKKFYWVLYMTLLVCFSTLWYVDCTGCLQHDEPHLCYQSASRFTRTAHVSDDWA